MISESFRPGREMRDGYVREVVGRYRERREWEVLREVREIVREVEGLVGASMRDASSDHYSAWTVQDGAHPNDR